MFYIIKIQKYFRGFLLRKYFIKKLENDYLLINMLVALDLLYKKLWLRKIFKKIHNYMKWIKIFKLIQKKYHNNLRNYLEKWKNNIKNQKNQKNENKLHQNSTKPKEESINSNFSKNKNLNKYIKIWAGIIKKKNIIFQLINTFNYINDINNLSIKTISKGGTVYTIEKPKDIINTSNFSFPNSYSQKELKKLNYELDKSQLSADFSVSNISFDNNNISLTPNNMTPFKYSERMTIQNNSYKNITPKKLNNKEIIENYFKLWFDVNKKVDKRKENLKLIFKSLKIQKYFNKWKLFVQQYKRELKEILSKTKENKNRKKLNKYFEIWNQLTNKNKRIYNRLIFTHKKTKSKKIIIKPHIINKKRNKSQNNKDNLKFIDDLLKNAFLKWKNKNKSEKMILNSYKKSIIKTLIQVKINRDKSNNLNLHAINTNLNNEKKISKIISGLLNLYKISKKRIFLKKWLNVYAQSPKENIIEKKSKGEIKNKEEEDRDINNKNKDLKNLYKNTENIEIKNKDIETKYKNKEFKDIQKIEIIQKEKKIETKNKKKDLLNIENENEIKDDTKTQNKELDNIKNEKEKYFEEKSKIKGETKKKILVFNLKTNNKISTNELEYETPENINTEEINFVNEKYKIMKNVLEKDNSYRNLNLTSPQIKNRKMKKRTDLILNNVDNSLLNDKNVLTIIKTGCYKKINLQKIKKKKIGDKFSKTEMIRKSKNKIRKFFIDDYSFDESLNLSFTKINNSKKILLNTDLKDNVEKENTQINNNVYNKQTSLNNINVHDNFDFYNKNKKDIKDNINDSDNGGNVNFDTNNSNYNNYYNIENNSINNNNNKIKNKTNIISVININEKNTKEDINNMISQINVNENNENNNNTLNINEKKKSNSEKESNVEKNYNNNNIMNKVFLNGSENNKSESNYNENKENKNVVVNKLIIEDKSLKENNNIINKNNLNESDINNDNGNENNIKNDKRIDMINKKDYKKEKNDKIISINIKDNIKSKTKEKTEETDYKNNNNLKKNYGVSLKIIISIYNKFLLKKILDTWQNKILSPHSSDRSKPSTTLSYNKIDSSSKLNIIGDNLEMNKINNENNKNKISILKNVKNMNLIPNRNLSLSPEKLKILLKNNNESKNNINSPSFSSNQFENSLSIPKTDNSDRISLNLSRKSNIRQGVISLHNVNQNIFDKSNSLNIYSNDSNSNYRDEKDSLNENLSNYQPPKKIKEIVIENLNINKQFWKEKEREQNIENNKRITNINTVQDYSMNNNYLYEEKNSYYNNKIEENSNKKINENKNNTINKLGVQKIQYSSNNKYQYKPPRLPVNSFTIKNNLNGETNLNENMKIINLKVNNQNKNNSNNKIYMRNINIFPAKVYNKKEEININNLKNETNKSIKFPYLINNNITFSPYYYSNEIGKKEEEETVKSDTDSSLNNSLSGISLIETHNEKLNSIKYTSQSFVISKDVRNILETKNISISKSPMRMKGDFEDFIDIDPNYKFKKNQRIQITNAQVPITHILNNEEIYVKNEKEATKYIMEKIVEKGDRDIYSYRNYMNNCKNKSKKTFSISFPIKPNNTTKFGIINILGERNKNDSDKFELIHEGKYLFNSHSAKNINLNKSLSPNIGKNSRYEIKSLKISYKLKELNSSKFYHSSSRDKYIQEKNESLELKNKSYIYSILKKSLGPEKHNFVFKKTFSTRTFSQSPNCKNVLNLNNK